MYHWDLSTTCDCCTRYKDPLEIDEVIKLSSKKLQVRVLLAMDKGHSHQAQEVWPTALTVWARTKQLRIACLVCLSNGIADWIRDICDSYSVTQCLGVSPNRSYVLSLLPFNMSDGVSKALVIQGVEGAAKEKEEDTRAACIALTRDALKVPNAMNTRVSAYHRLSQDADAGVVIRFTELTERNLWLQHTKNLKGKDTEVTTSPDFPPTPPPPPTRHPPTPPPPPHPPPTPPHPPPPPPTPPPPHPPPT